MMTHRLLLGRNEDFFVALLRSQAKELNGLLTAIEENKTDDGHVQNCLKRVEVNIRGLRKLCPDN